MTFIWTVCQINRDHSFPQNAEFWAEPRNLAISAEFLSFHRIFQNLVLAGDKGTNTAYFGGVQAAVLYVYMISPWIHDCHSDSDSRNTENIELSSSEILPANLVDRLYLSAAVTGDKYCIFGRVQRPRKLITICGKFSIVSHGIWQTGPWNLEKFAAESCGPYKSRHHSRATESCDGDWYASVMLSTNQRPFRYRALIIYSCQWNTSVIS